MPDVTLAEMIEWHQSDLAFWERETVDPLPADETRFAIQRATLALLRRLAEPVSNGELLAALTTFADEKRDDEPARTMEQWRQHYPAPVATMRAALTEFIRRRVEG